MLNKRKLEKICKGFASHRRIEILSLLDTNPMSSLIDISDLTGANFKTISGHLQKMHNSGIVYKTSRGFNVTHRLSPLGKSVLKFLKTLE